MASFSLSAEHDCIKCSFIIHELTQHVVKVSTLSACFNGLKKLDRSKILNEKWSSFLEVAIKIRLSNWRKVGHVEPNETTYDELSSKILQVIADFVEQSKKCSLRKRVSVFLLLIKVTPFHWWVQEACYEKRLNWSWIPIQCITETTVHLLKTWISDWRNCVLLWSKLRWHWRNVEPKLLFDMTIFRM